MQISEERLQAKDLNQQGAVLLKTGNVDLAKEKFDKAIEIDPMLVDSYKNYGDLYMSKAMYTDAKNSYKKALLIEKDGYLSYLYANACIMNDEVSEAIENYNIAVSEGYDNDKVLFFIGLAYEKMDDDKMALRYFQKACAKNSMLPDYKIKKIDALMRLNMLKEAELEIDDFIKIFPDIFDGYHMKTQILLYTNRNEDAIKFSAAASEYFPEDADLTYDYAKTLAINGKFEEALSVIGKAKEMKYFEGSERDFLILEAEIYAEGGKFQKAIECCEKGIALEGEDDFDSEARFMLMNLYLDAKDYDNALKYTEQLINADTGDRFYCAALYFRGFCHKNLGNNKLAKTLFKEAVSIYRIITLEAPEAIDVYLYRAMSLKELEEFDKALDMIEIVERIAGEAAEVEMLKAEIYDAQGRKALAQQARQKAFEQKPELKGDSESVGE